ncbi:Serine/threonine-protein kinase TAO1 [Homalodisca vitripennis]|nr:Serine/threonine-protein kinase TAO1 [Homalodisca vitripennis]
MELETTQFLQQDRELGDFYEVSGRLGFSALAIVEASKESYPDDGGVSGSVLSLVHSKCPDS